MKNVQHLIEELKRYQVMEKENKQKIAELTKANGHIKDHIKFLESQLKDVEQLTPPVDHLINPVIQPLPHREDGSIGS